MIMGSSTRVTPQWLKDKGLVLQPDGSYKRPSTPMLQKALQQPSPRTADIFSGPVAQHTYKVESVVKTPVIASENKKIKNATKVEAYGLRFDSKLEKYLYDCLTEARIPFTFKVKYVLQEGFRYRYEAVLPITLEVDFLLYEHNCIADSKGYGNDSYPMKAKMLKKHLHDQGLDYRIETPSSQKACRELIESLQHGFTLSEPLSPGQIESRRKALKKEGWQLVPPWDSWINRQIEVYSEKEIMSLQKYDFEQLLK